MEEAGWKAWKAGCGRRMDGGVDGGMGLAGWSRARAWMEEAGWRVLDGEEWMGWRDGGGLVDGGTEPHEPNRTNPTATRTEPKPKRGCILRGSNF